MSEPFLIGIKKQPVRGLQKVGDEMRPSGERYVQIIFPLASPARDTQVSIFVPAKRGYGRFCLPQP